MPPWKQRYTYAVYGASRLIVEGANGEPVELARDHPVHAMWRKRLNRVLLDSIREKPRA